MNYQKIYQDFIASRRAREADIVGYSEKHHIVPKALGGGNEKANLIRLIPEDHIHAHILLARIHGGALWAAAHFMLKGRIGRTGSLKRVPTKAEVLAVGFARRMHAKFCVGENASQYGNKHSEETRAKMSKSHLARGGLAWSQRAENKPCFSGDNHWTRNPDKAEALANALPKFIANFKIASEANRGDGNAMRRPEVAEKVKRALREQYASGVKAGSPSNILKRAEGHRTEEYRAKARAMFASKSHVMGGSFGENPNSRKVKCVETGVIFNSVKEASIFCGGKDVTRASRTGGRAGGYHWERLGTHAADGRVMKNG